jgi:hypothetical protein
MVDGDANGNHKEASYSTLQHGVVAAGAHTKLSEVRIPRDVHDYN